MCIEGGEVCKTKNSQTFSNAVVYKCFTLNYVMTLCDNEYACKSSIIYIYIIIYFHTQYWYKNTHSII